MALTSTFTEDLDVETTYEFEFSAFTCPLEECCREISYQSVDESG